MRRDLVECIASKRSCDCAIAPSGACTTILWPRNQGVYMNPARGVTSTSGNRPTWVGSLLANGVGSTGMAYRRNRFYDGATGQFNQQDPIGLAGGANSYGFAGGDPVNYADPFGLCPQPGRPCPKRFTGADGVAVLGRLARMGPAMETAIERGTAVAAAPMAVAVAAEAGATTAVGRILIGEGMLQLRELAQEYGAEILEGMFNSAKEAVEASVKWVSAAMDQGKEILDAGTQPGRIAKPSYPYRAEKGVIGRRNYPVTAIPRH